MRKLISTFVTLALFMVIATPVKAVNLLTNGDFSAGSTGWTLFSDPGPNNTSFINGGAFALNANALDRGVGITQSVSGLAVGQSYLVEVDVSNFFPQFGTTTGLNFGVFIDSPGVDSSSTTSSDLLGIGNATGVFGSFSHQFVADATAIDLRLLSQLEDDRSFNVDNVSLTLVNAVPLPASLPLLAGAVGLLAWTSRRRSHR